VATREDGLTDSLSLFLANACNPLLQAHPPWVQDKTSRGSLFCSPLCSVSRRPIWAGTRNDNLLVGPGTPRGRNADKTKQKSPQIGVGVSLPRITRADELTMGTGGLAARRPIRRAIKGRVIVDFARKRTDGFALARCRPPTPPTASGGDEWMGRHGGAPRSSFPPLSSLSPDP
jgi:hypothetical protein